MDIQKEAEASPDETVDVSVKRPTWAVAEGNDGARRHYDINEDGNETVIAVFSDGADAHEATEAVNFFRRLAARNA